eukprot:GHVN01014835.1.p1 GENE.GHVN01014835.1~~GHVN01014835.1.p1  ORF type:complete len:238 (-),score=28.25 GHVN01014835.1:199-912(-)
MEVGGLKIEETLSRLNCRYQSLFFIASIGTVMASFVGVLTSLLYFEMANMVNCVFLCVFGLTMMVIDIPGCPRWASRYRQVVRKYFRFLTRLTGKSLWFLYLGCLVAVSLWPSEHLSRDMGMVFFALSLSLFIVTVAFIGLLISIKKSLVLEKVRQALRAQFRGDALEAYRKWALTEPSHGMQFEEFNRMASEVTANRICFDVTDLGIIYNALDEHQKSAINEKEFSDWYQGMLTYV